LEEDPRFAVEAKDEGKYVLW